MQNTQRTNYHTVPGHDILTMFNAAAQGLSAEEVTARRQKYGPNTLPRQAAPGFLKLFFRQFLSPLIYVLLIAAAISLFLHEYSDAFFIFIVLMLNATIGAIQEHAAEQNAEALKNMVSTQAKVLRDGAEHTINAEDLVPGDLVLLESGVKIPADLRLLHTQGLEINESLLTGESLPVKKNAGQVLPDTAGLGDRINMAHAGTLAVRGRGRGLVTATGIHTEIGQLAKAISTGEEAPHPLMARIHKFTIGITWAVLGAITTIMAIEIGRGTPFHDIFLIAAALAVAAIPEGLPIAMTVALSIGMKRMAQHNVIVRKLVAVESLGSCTYIASDKTGTLTINEMTVQRMGLPQGKTIALSETAPSLEEKKLLDRAALAGVLCNEGIYRSSDGKHTFEGDAVDTALLKFANQSGLSIHDMRRQNPRLDIIPYESEKQYAAVLCREKDQSTAFVKGALERMIPMITSASTDKGKIPIDPSLIEQQALSLAEEGYRVLAVAEGTVPHDTQKPFTEKDLTSLTLLGLIGFIDPLRPEAKQAVKECQQAGVRVAMVTGDHPSTAFAIARELDFAQQKEQVITGAQLRQAEQEGPDAIDLLTKDARVFARVDPKQKWQIIQSLARHGHYVAVTGDGANDAPALKAAHVGVAMSKRGTDVARESADLLLTDDNFSSIAAGIKQGRVAYANVRKVIDLSLSTGAAEIVIFFLSLFMGLPLPLVAVQLLWLNLVTNGIQDVALAFEPEEGDEMTRPPRPPQEGIFNRLMIERVLIAATVMGGASFLLFQYLLSNGIPVDSARNSVLLLMVLFENVYVFNCRSEIRSAFKHNPWKNRILLIGTITAQLIHIGAMHTPGLNKILGVHPVSLTHWFTLLGLALILMAVVETHKHIRSILLKKRTGK